MSENNVNITKRAYAFQGYASSYKTEILNSVYSELQLKDIESAIRNKLKRLLTELTGFKYMTTVFLVLKKIESDDKTKYDTFYSYSKAETFINESDIDDLFKSIYATIISNIQKFLRKGSNIILIFQSIIPWLVTVI